MTQRGDYDLRLKTRLTNCS